jgi:hypothetical protein
MVVMAAKCARVEFGVEAAGWLDVVEWERS